MLFWEWTALLCGGVLAGVINTLAGGGSLLTVPLLILVGVAPNVANGTNRIAVLSQSLVASATLHKRGLSGLRPGLGLLPAGLSGAALGAYLSTELSDELFRQLFGLLMVPMALVITLRPRRVKVARSQNEQPRHPLGLHLAYFFVGAYAGFIQAGVGIFALAALSLFGGYDLRRANAVKVVTIAAFTGAALIFFIVRLDEPLAYGIGIALAVATGLGGYLGSLAVLKRGESLARIVMLIACVALAIRMLWG